MRTLRVYRGVTKVSRHVFVFSVSSLADGKCLLFFARLHVAEMSSLDKRLFMQVGLDGNYYDDYAMEDTAAIHERPDGSQSLDRKGLKEAAGLAFGGDVSKLIKLAAGFAFAVMLFIVFTEAGFAEHCLTGGPGREPLGLTPSRWLPHLLELVEDGIVGESSGLVWEAFRKIADLSRYFEVFKAPNDEGQRFTRTICDAREVNARGHRPPSVNLFELKDQLDMICRQMPAAHLVVYDISHFYHRIPLPAFMKRHFTLAVKEPGTSKVRIFFYNVLAMGWSLREPRKRPEPAAFPVPSRGRRLAATSDVLSVRQRTHCRPQ